MAQRRDVFEPTSPARMSPEQRLGELAAILATGVIRLRRRRCQSIDLLAPATPDFLEKLLEFPREVSPDGQRG